MTGKSWTPWWLQKEFPWKEVGMRCSFGSRSMFNRWRWCWEMKNIYDSLNWKLFKKLWLDDVHYLGFSHWIVLLRNENDLYKITINNAKNEANYSLECFRNVLTENRIGVMYCQCSCSTWCHSWHQWKVPNNIDELNWIENAPYKCQIKTSAIFFWCLSNVLQNFSI